MILKNVINFIQKARAPGYSYSPQLRSSTHSKSLGSGLSRTTGIQGLNYSTVNWKSRTGATILPLGKEAEEIYEGDDALPHYLLQKLQIQPPPARVEEYKRKPYTGREDMVDLFDNWAVMIHRAVSEMLAKKDALWTEIRNAPEIHMHMPEVKQYLYDDAYSYIRLVYECRRKLTETKGKAMTRYLTCRQHKDEKAADSDLTDRKLPDPTCMMASSYSATPGQNTYK